MTWKNSYYIWLITLRFRKRSLTDACTLMCAFFFPQEGKLNNLKFDLVTIKSRRFKAARHDLNWAPLVRLASVVCLPWQQRWMRGWRLSGTQSLQLKDNKHKYGDDHQSG